MLALAHNFLSLLPQNILLWEGNRTIGPWEFSFPQFWAFSWSSTIVSFLLSRHAHSPVLIRKELQLPSISFDCFILFPKLCESRYHSSFEGFCYTCPAPDVQSEEEHTVWMSKVSVIHDGLISCSSCYFSNSLHWRSFNIEREHTFCLCAMVIFKHIHKASLRATCFALSIKVISSGG